MGEAIPLALFQQVDAGLKLFTDKDCLLEEKVDETNTIQKVYKLTMPNVIRGKRKYTTRYIKNTGHEQLLYAIFPTIETGVEVSFKVGDELVERDLASGILLPTGTHKLDIIVDVPKVGDFPELYLGVATRPIISN